MNKEFPSYISVASIPFFVAGISMILFVVMNFNLDSVIACIIILIIPAVLIGIGISFIILDIQEVNHDT